MKLETKYLGLHLNNPVIISSSPFTMSADRIKRLEESGAGAVVLKSIFEEQIAGEAAYLDQYNDYPEAADYLRQYVGNDYVRGHLQLIADAKKSVGMPVIASINCNTPGTWTDYARQIESAGADALELNIFLLPTDPAAKSTDIEQQYLDIVSSVAGSVKIPVSVKLGMRFTNVLSVCRQIYNRGGKGVVMFNRFVEPDIDIDNISMTASGPLSSQTELRNNLRSIGMCSANVPALDIAANTGIHEGADAVKAILAGAKAVEVCTALYLHGLEAIGKINKFIVEWMTAHSLDKIEEFRGMLDYKAQGDSDFYQRVQYMKWFPTEVL